MSDYRVSIEGLDKFQKLANSSPIIEKEFKDAMGKAVADVEAEVKPLVPVGVSGRARGSIGSQVEERGGSIVGVVGSNIKEVYPKVIEFGRRPGAPAPPASALQRWVVRVMGVAPERSLGVAIVLAQRIARRGIKGKFPFKRGFEQAREGITGYFNGALKNIVKGLTK